MLRVGLTGGIASGKSTVAALFADLGAFVVDADRVAREVVEPGTAGLHAVTEAFGDRVLDPDGALDRAALGRLVFTDADARRRLEEITHPLIATRTEQLLSSAGRDRIVVHDVPLLVEKAMGDRYHVVVVVHAEAAERIRRLTTIRGMAPADARARVEAQATDDARRSAADVLLDSSPGVEALAAGARALWQRRIVPFDTNVRTRRPAERGPVRVTLPDPRWPEAAARLRARIARAVGGHGQAVEHIGSTAVPGLPAKDVIDLMLGVPDLETADRLRPALEDAGFASAPDLVTDHPHPDVDADPRAWQKRVHASCDPGRPANLHVRVTGGPGWRTALLMRDWLRADPAARSEYAALKAGLAASGRSSNDYADAKEPWVTQAVPRALAWAAGGPSRE